MKPLIGNVTVQFTCPATTDDVLAHIEANRVEQEEVNGYPLVFLRRNMMKLQDADGKEYYEVFATYAPVPNPEN